MNFNKISFAPLPTFKGVARAIGLFKNDSYNFSDLKSLNSSNFYWFSRSSWAIYTIAKFRLEMYSDRYINVWIPDYFCNSSLAQLRTLNVKINFYPIDSKRKPDLIYFQKMLMNEAPDLILFVDYFGESLFSKEIFEIASSHNAWLIEDCAHCILPFLRPNTADFVLYSPHKLLPIPDGGSLIIKENGPNKLSQQILDKFNFKETYYSVIKKEKNINFSEYKWLIKRLLQKFGFKSNFSKLSFKPQVSEVDLNNYDKPSISKMAKRLFFENSIDINYESEAREKNFTGWVNFIKKNKFLNSKVEVIPINFVPYLLELRVLDHNDTERIFNSFKFFQVPVTSWPDLAPEVFADPKKHKIAIDMRFNRIFLPVHSSINPELIKSNLKSFRVQGE